MEPSGPMDLEAAFFAKENVRLLEDLRRQAEREERREVLRRVVSIEDDAFLDRLIVMGIGPERAMALRLIPLVFVAWADGNVDEKEREAILRAAKKQGVASEEIALKVLRDWLQTKPDPKILVLWKDYIKQIWNRFSADEQIQMQHNLLAAAREVAEAAGGFLGVGKISKAEREMLEELEQITE